MTIVLAKGNYRFSGETDDYPPDVTRRTKKASKEKKSRQAPVPSIPLWSRSPSPTPRALSSPLS
jgi:hypothetical protein